MKRILDFTLLVALLVTFNLNPASSQARKDVVEYDSYFTPERLRLDLVFAGNNLVQQVHLQGLKKESLWAGSQKNLLDPFRYGEYFYEVSVGDKVIFSKGFNTLFQEWRTTAESKTVSKAFNNSIWIPFPKQEVSVTLYERVKESGQFAKLNSFTINPTDKQINCEKENDFNVVTLLNSGEMSKKVDLLFIAEGYNSQEMVKFRKDCEKFMNYLFEMEPYKSRKSDFNIHAVESISKDSGTDFPHKDIWKNTIAHSNFYTFGIDRYLTAPDHRAVATLASNALFDAIYVIVNSEVYGGGGVYNYYGLSTSDNSLYAEVFVHEFGHSFAGLADEYYNSSVAYEDFYNLKVEPWEPNITTLVSFESKWKGMIDKKTPTPTPNEKKYDGIVGLFEGGGYMAKGIFRPSLDCRMHTNKAPGFCPVCQKAISDMIDYYVR